MKTDLKDTVGAVVLRAESSLSQFAIALADGRGIVLNAQEGPQIETTTTEAQNLPKLSEAVCSVDWSWIQKSVLEDVQVSSTAVRLKLNPAGPLTVSAGVWQGSPFLSFMPYKPAK